MSFPEGSGWPRLGDRLWDSNCYALDQSYLQWQNVALWLSVQVPPLTLSLIVQLSWPTTIYLYFILLGIPMLNEKGDVNAKINNLAQSSKQPQLPSTRCCNLGGD